MAETKSWASSQTAKEAQALFQCLSHNLTLLFEQAIQCAEGIDDKVETRKKHRRQKTRKNREGEPTSKRITS
ncbi:hypothetical protein JIN85_01085 [Luteolibacter pohnpeiensis]|uniref:Uncharacterized protein n=1 Tax=Luteolibacter pohnpeiensis TaxID=454153 RepID=A0A934VPG8_9BACT|nr:hypothetical protein [Luteolibacter pohnpeiensis]MBK1880986.1 hypothetical protein [Luteolibacter pohnpeiensis]